MLGRMGPNGSALVNFCQSLNEAVLKIVAIVIWYVILQHVWWEIYTNTSPRHISYTMLYRQ